MAAGVWTVYDQAKLKLGKKLLDLINDTFKVALFTSSSNVGSASLATATYGAATNEVAAVNGYSTAGVTVAATWTNSAGTETFDFADPSWTASGGSIVARWAVVYDSTTGDLIAFSLLDTSPADVTVVSGTTYTLQIDALGAFTMA